MLEPFRKINMPADFQLICQHVITSAHNKWLLAFLPNWDIFMLRIRKQLFPFSYLFILRNIVFFGEIIFHLSKIMFLFIN